MIDWDNIAQAIDAYRTLGYKYVEVPWVVSDAAIKVTLPSDHVAQRCQDGPLVGSAEQSFIQMMLDGTLKPGRYVAASPCFRDDKPDRWHMRTFFKVELIEYSQMPFSYVDERISRMVTHAADFFWCCGAEEVERVNTEQGIDIELGGIEIGSYGHRQFETHHWVYGTGYADPRFTMALEAVLGRA